MKTRLLMLIATAMPMCSSRPGIAEGNYRRTAYMALDRSGNVMRPLQEIDEALPAAIRILPEHVYEIDARTARIRGNYRVERDSVFFDDRGANGQTVVSLFGVLNGDTLQLRAPAILMVLGGAPGMDLLVNFMRSSR